MLEKRALKFYNTVRSHLAAYDMRFNCSADRTYLHGPEKALRCFQSLAALPSPPPPLSRTKKKGGGGSEGYGARAVVCSHMVLTIT